MDGKCGPLANGLSAEENGATVAVDKANVALAMTSAVLTNATLATVSYHSQSGRLPGRLAIPPMEPVAIQMATPAM